MNSAQTNINEIDLTFSADELPKGRSGFMGITQRGPVNDPSILINSWPQFVKIYGGLMDNNIFPLLCKRALDGGAALRVCRIAHYTTISDASTLAALFADQVTTNVFTFSAAPAAGHTVTFNIGATTVSQVFTTSALNTLNLLKAQILATFVDAQDITVVDSTHLKAAVKTGAVTTVAATGSGAPTVTKTQLGINYSGTELFTIDPKYPGVAYNNLRVVIKAPSNGRTSYFDMTVELVGEADSLETYQNLIIPGKITAQASNYLQTPITKSKLVNFVYNDLTALAGALPIVPQYNIIRFNGGSDGAAPVAADFIGDSASRTGFQAFNIIDDIMQLGFSDTDDTDLDSDKSIHIAGSAYADNRKDLMYWGHLSNDLDTEQLLEDERRDIGVNSNYTAFFAGGLKVLNPITNNTVNISELGDMFALAAKSDFNFGEWYSFAGAQRGVLKNILGIVNNFGATGNVAGMNQLADANINVVINRNTKSMLWGSFTAQVDTSTLSFINVRRLIIHLKKTLRPILDTYLEEPNDFVTWRKIYMEVQPILNALATKRAFYGPEDEGWKWQGDQFADKLSDLVINDPTDVGLGKYLVRLFVKDVVSLQWIQVDVVLTSAGVSFEEALTEIIT